MRQMVRGGIGSISMDCCLFRMQWEFAPSLAGIAFCSLLVKLPFISLHCIYFYCSVLTINQSFACYTVCVCTHPV